MNDPQKSPQPDRHFAVAGPYVDRDGDIARWSLANTRMIRDAGHSSAGGFAADITFDGRRVLAVFSPGRGRSVSYSRLDDETPWESLLQGAARQWLADLGVDTTHFDHYREVWLDWKMFGTPDLAGERQLAASLGEALIATPSAANDLDWALMEELFGPGDAA